MVRLGGAYEGRVHDSRAYQNENIEYELKDMCEEFDGGDENSESDDDDDVASFTIYADAAYGKTKYTKRVYKSHRGRIGVAKDKFNGLMSSCRTDVEHGFGAVKVFKWMECKTQIRLLQSIQRPNDTKSAYDMKVYVSFFLTNLYMCLNHGQVNASNQCCPPEIEEYLALRDMYLDDNDDDDDE